MIGWCCPVAMVAILMRMCVLSPRILSSWRILQCPITMAMGSRGHGDSAMCSTPGRPVAMAKEPSVRATLPICYYAISPQHHTGSGAGLILSWVSLMGFSLWVLGLRGERGRHKMANWAQRSAKPTFLAIKTAFGEFSLSLHCISALFFVVVTQKSINVVFRQYILSFIVHNASKVIHTLSTLCPSLTLCKVNFSRIVQLIIRLYSFSPFLPDSL